MISMDVHCIIIFVESMWHEVSIYVVKQITAHQVLVSVNSRCVIICINTQNIQTAHKRPVLSYYLLKPLFIY